MGAGRRAKRILGRFLGGVCQRVRALPDGEFDIQRGLSRLQSPGACFLRAAKIALLFESSELALARHVARKHGSTVTRALFFDLDSRSSD